MSVAVEVWCVDLAAATAPTAADLAHLSEAERVRHGRYLSAEAARIFATTRLALRTLLGRRLARDPHALPLLADAHGKPRIADAPHAFFSVSHCATHALIVFCDAAPVGVDVELRGALLPDDVLAGSICVPAERAWLGRVGGADAAALTRVWTRKEAALKALGVGLTMAPVQLALVEPGAAAGVFALPSGGHVAWLDLDGPVELIAAVAACARAREALAVTWHEFLP